MTRCMLRVVHLLVRCYTRPDVGLHCSSFVVHFSCSSTIPFYLLPANFTMTFACCRPQDPCTSMARATIYRAKKAQVMLTFVSTTSSHSFLLETTSPGRKLGLRYGFGNKYEPFLLDCIHKLNGVSRRTICTVNSSASPQGREKRWPTCRVSITCKSGTQSEEGSCLIPSLVTTIAMLMEGH